MANAPKIEDIYNDLAASVSSTSQLITSEVENMWYTETNANEITLNEITPNEYAYDGEITYITELDTFVHSGIIEFGYKQKIRYRNNKKKRLYNHG